jgi:hypothetical protein
MKKKISGYLAIDVVFVLQSLHRRSLAEIVITGKTRAAGQMWILRPHGVIPFHIPLGPDFDNVPRTVAVSARQYSANGLTYKLESLSTAEWYGYQTKPMPLLSIRT